MRTHVRESRQVLCRLARRQRRPKTQILQDLPRSPHVRSTAKGTRPPKTEGARPTLVRILCARYEGHPNTHLFQAAKALIAQAGSLPPQKLCAAHIADIDQALFDSQYAHTTKAMRAAAIRNVLRWLWEVHGAPKLDSHVRRYPGVRPRNIVVTREEADAILTAAPDHLRLWLLFCADLAIRSGTAANLAPGDYQKSTGILRFTTKYGARLTMPVTQEIADLLAGCDMDTRIPFVRQLWRRYQQGHPGGRPHAESKQATGLRYSFRVLLRTLNITRRIVPHDLRRTAAVGMLELTHDIRDVQALLGHRTLQATLWYLDHDLRPVKRAHLELIKRAITPKEQTA